MARVENWASTWANHKSGSAGQNGDSLRDMALTRAVAKFFGVGGQRKGESICALARRKFFLTTPI